MESEVRTTRPTLDEYFMQLAKAASSRSTCRHRWQGVVIVRDKHVISMGYNGAPPGQKDCLEWGNCAKEEDLTCRAEGMHGESNAIISAARLGISTSFTTMYCIYSPCLVCCNMIKSAGIQTVKYLEVYTGFPEGPGYLLDLGVKVGRLEAK